MVGVTGAGAVLVPPEGPPDDAEAVGLLVEALPGELAFPGAVGKPGAGLRLLGDALGLQAVDQGLQLRI